MSRGAIIFLLMALSMFSFAPYMRVGAQEPQMLLEHKDVFRKLQRPAVKFDHEKHADKYPDCVQCHHQYEYKEGERVNVWGGEGQPCSECHKMKKEGKKASLRTAFHENCTGCHRTLPKEENNIAPETCGECHIRGAQVGK